MTWTPTRAEWDRTLTRVGRWIGWAGALPLLRRRVGARARTRRLVALWRGRFVVPVPDMGAGGA